MPFELRSSDWRLTRAESVDGMVPLSSFADSRSTDSAVRAPNPPGMAPLSWLYERSRDCSAVIAASSGAIEPLRLLLANDRVLKQKHHASNQPY